MKIMGFKPTSCKFALLFCILLTASGYCEEYQVKLQNGRVIRVANYYEQDGTIFLLRYGNYIGIEKSTVLEIVKVHDPADSTKPKQSKEAESGTKAAESSVSRSDKSSALAPVNQPKNGQAKENAGSSTAEVAQQKAPGEKSVKEEQRQREDREQFPAILDSSRLREIGELDQTISRLRNERLKTCSGSETPATGKPGVPASKPPEETAARVSTAGNTANRCSYLTSQIDELEKKLQGLKDTDTTTAPDKGSSKTVSTHKIQKGS